MDRVGDDLVKAGADRRRVDSNRPVGQALRIFGIRFPIRVDGREMRERPAVVIDLDLLLFGGHRDAVRAGKQAVQIVEAMILGVDDYDVLYALELRVVGGDGAAAAEQANEDEPADSSHRFVPGTDLGGERGIRTLDTGLIRITP